MTDPNKTDPFLWLEEVEGKEALAWVEEQNKETMEELKADPRFEVIEEAALEVLNSDDRLPLGVCRVGQEGAHVYNFWQGGDHKRGIWQRASRESYLSGEPEWDILLDIDSLAEAENENWVYKGALLLAPAYDRAMITLSRGGKDASVEREFDLTARSFIEGGFYLPEAKSILAWMGRDTLLVRTDFGEGSLTTSGYGRQVKLWQRDTPLEDAELVAEGEVDDVGMFPGSSFVDGRYIGSNTRMITFFETDMKFLVDGKHLTVPVPKKFDFYGFHEGECIFLLREEWTVAGQTFESGLLISFPLKELLEGAIKTVSVIYRPTSRSAVETGALVKSGIYLATLDNVIAKVSHFSFEKVGWVETPVDLPGSGAIGALMGTQSSDDAFVTYENFLTPPTLYHLDQGGGHIKPIMSLPAQFDEDGLEVWQFETESSDGERIPYFVVAREAMALNGTNPTLLNAYGGFNVSRTPAYSAALGKGWLESGGVYVLANIRGGGEFGPSWHDAALKENRQKCFDDFAAVAEDLIARQITSPRHLGISGGSNGGLLVGATVAQHPELFNAVLCDVPLLDMLRYHKLLAGASWIGEYGDPDIPEERAYIEKYSPYQNVSADKTYPRILFYTSTKDDRVHPGHARKMAALMKEQGHTPLFYENTEGGHGRGTNMDQHARQYAMQYTYLWRQLGRN